MNNAQRLILREKAAGLTGTPAERAAAINAERVATSPDVLWLTPEQLLSRLVAAYGVANGSAIAERLLGTLRAASAASAIIEVAYRRLVNSDRGLNLADPATLGILSTLVVDGGLTVDDVAAIGALVTPDVRAWPAVYLGVPYVTEHDLAAVEAI